MGFFGSSKPSSPAFHFDRPGIPPRDFNPILFSLTKTVRPVKFVSLVHIGTIYPTALVRLEFADKQVDQPESWIFKPQMAKAETEHDAAKWVVDTAWALGATKVLNFRTPPEDKVIDTRAHSLQTMWRNRVMAPKINERMAGAEVSKERELATKKGSWFWSFNLLGPCWNTLSSTDRRKVLEGDLTLRVRSDGCRTLPVPTPYFGWLYNNPMRWITFAEMNQAGAEFTPKNPIEDGNPFAE